MARVQTRRTISINGRLWSLVHAVAARRGESAAEYVATAICARLSREGRKRLPRLKFAGPAANGRTNNRGAAVGKAATPIEREWRQLKRSWGMS